MTTKRTEDIAWAREVTGDQTSPIHVSKVNVKLSNYWVEIPFDETVKHSHVIFVLKGDKRRIMRVPSPYFEKGVVRRVIHQRYAIHIDSNTYADKRGKSANKPFQQFIVHEE